MQAIEGLEFIVPSDDEGGAPTAGVVTSVVEQEAPTTQEEMVCFYQGGLKACYKSKKECLNSGCQRGASSIAQGVAVSNALLDGLKKQK